MKQLLFIFTLVLSVSCFGQVYIQEIPADTLKPKYNYVLIYRDVRFGAGITSFNGYGTIEQTHWQTIAEPFATLYDVLERLNGKNVFGKPIVMIEEKNIIGIYDLVSGGKVKLKLNTEKKSTPKKIVVEAKEWVEEFYELVAPKKQVSFIKITDAGTSGPEYPQSYRDNGKRNVSIIKPMNFSNRFSPISESLWTIKATDWYFRPNPTGAGNESGEGGKIIITGWDSVIISGTNNTLIGKGEKNITTGNYNIIVSDEDLQLTGREEMRFYVDYKTEWLKKNPKAVKLLKEYELIAHSEIDTKERRAQFQKELLKVIK